MHANTLHVRLLDFFSPLIALLPSGIKLACINRTNIIAATLPCLHIPSLPMQLCKSACMQQQNKIPLLSLTCLHSPQKDIILLAATAR
jgi:exoribonuclease II